MTKGATLQDITIKKNHHFMQMLIILKKSNKGAITPEEELQTNTFNKRMT
jgi:hypothetical protein